MSPFAPALPQPTRRRTWQALSPRAHPSRPARDPGRRPRPLARRPGPRAGRPAAVLERRRRRSRRSSTSSATPPPRAAPIFVAPDDRIATFDQDGTTWVEQPLYGQGLFALDRLAEMAPEHPEWKETEPFKSVLTGDHAAMAKFTEKDWMEIVAVTHAGMSTDRLRGDRRRLAAEVEEPLLRPPGHRAHLPADARGDGLPARQRLPHLHRHRRRPGVRPGLLRGRLRHPARAGRRLQHRDQVRDEGRQAGADARAQGLLHRRRRRQGRSASTSSSASARRSPSATPTATRRCCNGRPAATAPGLGLLVLHDDAEREFAYGPADGLPDSKIGTFSQALMDDRQGGRLDGDQHEGRLEDHLRRRHRQGEMTLATRGGVST